MNRLSWTVSVLSALLGVRAAGEELRELKYNENTTLAAEVHVARQPDEALLAAYLSIDNRFKNTIECGGQLLAAIEKDGKIVNLLLRFGNLRVFPSEAFSYPLVHLVGSRIELPSGYVFVAQEYPPLKVSCRGWSYLQYLHPQFCQQNEVETCSGDKVSYPYMIDEYWLGLCRC